LEKLAKWDDEMDKINDILQFKFELNDLMGLAASISSEFTNSEEVKESKLLPNINSTISFPQGNNTLPKTKRGNDS
jgi:hypothetical protein